MRCGRRCKGCGVRGCVRVLDPGAPSNRTEPATNRRPAPRPVLGDITNSPAATSPPCQALPFPPGQEEEQVDTSAGKVSHIGALHPWFHQGFHANAHVGQGLQKQVELNIACSYIVHALLLCAQVAGRPRALQQLLASQPHRRCHRRWHPLPLPTPRHHPLTRGVSCTA